MQHQSLIDGKVWYTATAAYLSRRSCTRASDSCVSCTVKQSSCCSSCLNGPKPDCCVVAPSSCFTAEAIWELVSTMEGHLSRCSAAARLARAAAELPGHASSVAARMSLASLWLRLDCCLARLDCCW